MAYQDVRERLAALGADGGEAFWNAVRGNLTRVDDVVQWWAVVNGPVTPAIEDRAFIEAAARALPEGAWDTTTWKTWTEAVKAATGVKGKALFMPLRLALTGREHGPELAPLMPLIGHDKARRRLNGETA
jgi:glutamyl-tRNA synthetase